VLVYSVNLFYKNSLLFFLKSNLKGISKLTDYCSSKYAAVGLHDALTAELKQTKKTGIQTTVICPAFINTGMFHGVSSS
jgi:all-trans-retinol dehydrogenase (NAD+)